MCSLNNYIKKLANYIRKHPRSLLMQIDDAGGIKLNDEYIVIKTDGFTASRAKYPWCSYRDFGFKAITANVSDIFSKGCRPLIYAISIGITQNNIEIIEEIMKGLDDAIKFYGGYIENMDTNIGNDIWIDVFAIGVCRYLPIPRKTRVGDIFLVSRKLGLSAIAYREYSKGRTPIDEDVQRFSCRPAIDLRIIDAIENLRNCIIGSIDISDTLYETLEQIVYINNTGIYIDNDPRNILYNKAIAYTYIDNLNPLDFLMEVNEEYTPILIIDKNYLEYVISYLRDIGFDPHLLGISISSKEILWRGEYIAKYVWSYELGKIIKARQDDTK